MSAYPRLPYWRIIALNDSSPSAIAFLSVMGEMENVRSDLFGVANVIRFNHPPKYYHVVVNTWAEENGEGMHTVFNVKPGSGQFAANTRVDPFKSWMVTINPSYPPEVPEGEA